MTNKKRDIILSVVFTAVIVALLIYVDKEQHYSMLASVIQKASIYALLAVSLNLLNGFTGLFSLGQAGFMMLGAYTYAILTIPLEQHASVYQYFNGGVVNVCLPPIVGVIAAGLVAVVFAWLVGKPCLRLKSDYLAIATLGFAEIIRAVFQWEGLGVITNGSNLLRKYTNFNDIQIQVGGTIFKLGTLFPFFIATLSILIIVLLVTSSYGRAFKSIRDDEVAAEAMGINLFKHKMLSFVISSFFAGVGGALLAMFQTTVQAAPFRSSMTYEILLMVVIGGIGSITGSVIASFLYISASEWWLRFLDSGGVTLFHTHFNIPFFRDGFRKVVFSVVIMVIVLFFSRGIMGDKELSFAGMIRRLRGKKAVPAAEGEEDAQ